MRRGLKHADHASGPAAANCAKRPKPGANDNEILLPLPLASYWWRNSPTTPPKAISFSTGHAANVPPDWSTKKWANRAATLQQGADVFRLGGSAHLDFYLTGSLRFLSATQPPFSVLLLFLTGDVLLSALSSQSGFSWLAEPTSDKKMQKLVSNTMQKLQAPVEVTVKPLPKRKGLFATWNDDGAPLEPAIARARAHALSA